MNLFLSSQGLPAELIPDFLSLFDRPAKQIHLAYIEDAAFPYEGQERPWLDAAWSELLATGVVVHPISLRDYEGNEAELIAQLEHTHGVWVAGGNAHFLRYWMRASGFDRIIGDFIDEGYVYAGFSAGSIVAGPTIEDFDHDGEAHLEPEVINEGLSLIDVTILPHWDDGQHDENMKKIAKRYEEKGLRTITIKDGEALMCQEEESWIVPE